MVDGVQLRLRTLLGDHPGTRALKRGEVHSPHVALDFADVKTPSSAFKRVVRDLEFDVAELAIMTFLMARAHGKPLVLLPAVLFSRPQHPYLVYDASRGALAPSDLAGRRVGIRSYSVTTVTWIRGVLADDHGVDAGRVRWITFEEPHVAEYRDPPSVERAPAGKQLLPMLLAGELDAAVVADISSLDPRLKPVIPDPERAGREWSRRNQALQLNHLVVVKAALTRSHPQAVAEIFRLLHESKLRGAAATDAANDATPFGVEANRRHLAVAIDQAYRQGLIPIRLAVDELFDDVTRRFNAHSCGT